MGRVLKVSTATQVDVATGESHRVVVLEIDGRVLTLSDAEAREMGARLEAAIESGELVDMVIATPITDARKH